MKNFLGILLVVAGIILGLYIGVWYLFVGGIVQVINSLMFPTNTIAMAIGVFKVLASGYIGWLVGLIIIFIGITILQ